MTTSERAASLEHLAVLRQAAMVAATAVVDPEGSVMPGRIAPTWPDDPDVAGAVVGNLHLARTAALACANHVDGLSSLALLDPAPMLAVGAIARSALEAAGQLWWLRQPIVADTVGDDVWVELAERAAAVAGCWHAWSARLTDHLLGAPARRPLSPDEVEELRKGAARSREYAATVQKEVEGLKFDYGRAARELMLDAGVSLSASVYARLCEVSHANPLGITRSDPKPDLIETGLMPWRATPSPEALCDAGSVDTFLLVTTKSISHAIVEGFRPAAGRTWGLQEDEWAILRTAADDWIEKVRPSGA